MAIAQSRLADRTTRSEAAPFTAALGSCCCHRRQPGSAGLWPLERSGCSSPKPHSAHWQDRATPVGTLRSPLRLSPAATAPTLLAFRLDRKRVDKTGSCFFTAPVALGIEHSGGGPVSNSGVGPTRRAWSTSPP